MSDTPTPVKPYLDTRDPVAILFEALCLALKTTPEAVRSSCPELDDLTTLATAHAASHGRDSGLSRALVDAVDAVAVEKMRAPEVQGSFERVRDQLGFGAVRLQSAGRHTDAVYLLYLAEVEFRPRSHAIAAIVEVLDDGRGSGPKHVGQFSFSGDPRDPLPPRPVRQAATAVRDAIRDDLLRRLELIESESLPPGKLQTIPGADDA